AGMGRLGADDPPHRPPSRQGAGADRALPRRRGGARLGFRQPRRRAGAPARAQALSRRRLHCVASVADLEVVSGPCAYRRIGVAKPPVVKPCETRSWKIEATSPVSGIALPVWRPRSNAMLMSLTPMAPSPE